MIIPIAVFIIAIVFHELAHGFVAYRMGDTTARDAGRLTLNPFVHADPVGTIILPLLLILSHSPIVFGWAKPVPVNPRNFKSSREGMLLTSFAGPAANFGLAALFAIFFKIFSPEIHSLSGSFLISGVIINLVLGTFNLIPIPPLDGSKIIFSILPSSMEKHFLWLERYGFIILIGLLYLGLFDKIILPLVSVLTRILVA